MTYEESIPIAKELSERALSKGFDVEAFIILSLLNSKNMIKDDVPDSYIDNEILHMYELFLSYINTHDTDTLSEFLHINAQMIDELYHSVYKPEDKNLFISYFNNMQTVSSG